MYAEAARRFLHVTTAWMQRGACTNADPELFHGRQPATMELAKKVCVGCPVVAECLDYALARMDYLPGEPNPATAPIGRYGVWGNTHASERWAILNRRTSQRGVARYARAS